jgi:branched-chain amino acid transport system ATP-binding protein
MQMLEVDAIDVYYGDLPALLKVSLVVNKREIVTICGSNGSGKTTLLKTVVGILHPKHGSIEFLDKKIDNFLPYSIVKEGISLVPEGGKVFPYSTVQDNLELGAYNFKVVHGSFRFIYEMFPALRGKEKRLAGTLSGGEQQMLAIGRALISEPKLLLFDEPSLGLAPMLVKKVFEVVKEINREKGLSILLSEQNVSKALELCDRAYILEIGRLILTGDGKEVLENDMVKKAYLGL